MNWYPSLRKRNQVLSAKTEIEIPTRSPPCDNTCDNILRISATRLAAIMAKAVISDQNRAFFEAVGFSAIRREIVIGSVHYLGIETDPRRVQAREWVAEQEAKLEKEKGDARALEAHRFRLILGWTIAGVLVAFVAAAAAAIAAWPVIKGWIE